MRLQSCFSTPITYHCACNPSFTVLRCEQTTCVRWWGSWWQPGAITYHSVMMTRALHQLTLQRMAHSLVPLLKVVSSQLDMLLSIPCWRVPWVRPRLSTRARYHSIRPYTAAHSATGQQRSVPELVYALSPASKHQFPGHKECPERVEAIAAALEAGGLTAAARPGQVLVVQGLKALPNNSGHCYATCAA